MAAFLGTLARAPDTAVAGDTYFDSTLVAMRYYDGVHGWRTVAGGSDVGQEVSQQQSEPADLDGDGLRGQLPALQTGGISGGGHVSLHHYYRKSPG